MTTNMQLPKRDAANLRRILKDYVTYSLDPDLLKTTSKVLGQLPTDRLDKEGFDVEWTRDTINAKCAFLTGGKWRPIVGGATR